MQGDHTRALREVARFLKGSLARLRWQHSALHAVWLANVSALRSLPARPLHAVWDGLWDYAFAVYDLRQRVKARAVAVESQLTRLVASGATSSGRPPSSTAPRWHV